MPAPHKPVRRRRSPSSRSTSDWEPVSDHSAEVPDDGVAPDFLLSAAGRAMQIPGAAYRRDHFFDRAKLDTAQLPLLSIRYLDQSNP